MPAAARLRRPQTQRAPRPRRRLAPVYLFVGEDTTADRPAWSTRSRRTIDEADRPFAVERLYAGEAGGIPVDIVSSRGCCRCSATGAWSSCCGPSGCSSRSARGRRPPKTTRRPVTATSEDAARRRGAARGVPRRARGFDDAGVRGDGHRSGPPADEAAARDGAGRGVRRAGRRTAIRARARQQAGTWVKDELVARRPGDRPEAAQVLAARAGGDITKLRDDVEKLLLFVGRPQAHHARRRDGGGVGSERGRGRLGGRQCDRGG